MARSRVANWAVGVSWNVRAPPVFPNPTVIIFARPLCTGPENEVCSFTRLTTSTPADSYAKRSIHTSLPTADSDGTVPIFTHSMLARIGMSSDFSVTPSDSSIATCPSAVPPLWVPIAGITNGRAP